MLDILRQGLAADFPNPERIGCPGSALLQGIAQGKVSLMEAEPWLDHLGSCSPCFREFSQFRRQVGLQRRRWQVSIAAAAVLVFAVAGGMWEKTRTPHSSADTAVLDLRDHSVPRGQNPTQTPQPSLKIYRTVKHLTLDLPIGSKEGDYELALLEGTGAEVLRTAGTARLEDHVVTLRSSVDLSNLQPGAYFLALRQPGLKWMRFLVRVL